MKRQHPMHESVRWGPLGRIALVAVSLLALVCAPTAGARTRHSLHSMVVHLRGADRATARLTAAPSGPLAGMYLARARAQTTKAADIARIIFRHDGSGSQRAATVLGLLADHQTSEAQTLTSVLGDVRPELQAPLAQAISTATGGRQVVLEMLSGMLPGLTADARPVVAQVVAMESTQGAQVPVQIANVLGANSVACDAAGAVQQALVVATQSFQLGLSNLGAALALVPAAVHRQVQSEIDGVPALLRQIAARLAQVLPCPAATTPAAGTGGKAPVVALKAPALLDGMTQLIDGILGRLLPGLGTGQPSTPVAAPAPLAGLLGGLGSLLGGLGGGATH